MIKSLLLDLENFPYTVRIYKNQSNKNNLCHRVLLNNQFTSSWTYFFLINKSTSIWSATSFTISVVVLRRKGNTNYSSTLRLILFSLEQFLSLKFTDSARFRQILLSTHAEWRAMSELPDFIFKLSRNLLLALLYIIELSSYLLISKKILRPIIGKFLFDPKFIWTQYVFLTLRFPLETRESLSNWTL